MPTLRSTAALIGGLSLLTGGLAAATTSTAHANPDGTDLVISEVYGGGGGSTGTPSYTHDFIELYNPTDEAISLEGWSIQYKSNTGATALTADLSGQVAAGSHYLIQSGSAGSVAGTPALPTPDATVGLNLSQSGGIVFLASSTAPVESRGDVAGVTAGGLVDTVGYGTSADTFETARTGVALTNTTAVARAADGADNDDNADDFTEGAPMPTACGDACAPPPPTAIDASIAEVQGTGSSSPLVGETVTTRGVVTAAYPTGGFFSFVIQTEGTGTGADATPGASDGLWVDHLCCGMDAEVGEFVEVTGVVEENFGRTELVYDPDEAPLTVLDEPFDAVSPLATAYPTTFADREAHESELLDVSSEQFTVSNNYPTNQYGEVGLATGDRPLITPTEVADAQDQAALQAVQDDNYARGVVLDDGASWDYVRDDRNFDNPLPWLSTDNTVRIGAPATVVGPVILDYGFGDWRFQPTSQVTDEGRDVALFGDTRPENAEPQDVGGDLKIATFNVLNYFNTTGMEFEAAGGECSYYYDRFGDEITNRQCTPDGPRGAAEDDDLQRQQAKIVEAINTLDADVVSLEEIENSVKLGEPDRDDALAELVAALNADAGEERWAFAPSPRANRLPALAEQDVIRTAFIYDPDTVRLLGPSRVLVGSEAFADAREPLAQAFKPLWAEDDQAFAVIANHFKSKGSACEGESEGVQGNCNETRVAQAHALVDFADEVKAERGLDKVFLAGDFNSYAMEDPIQVLEEAGYTRLESDTADEWSYSFDGMSGSLDHVLANDAALAGVTGVDIWEINANEAVAFEYSRFNQNITQLYQANVFRASDHNPELVGLDVD